MKKILFLAVAAMLSFAAVAQNKGDMFAGGMVGLSTGGSNANVVYNGNVGEKTSEIATVNFLFSVDYGYFVIDNLAVSAGLEYALQAQPSSEVRGKQYFQLVNAALFKIGAGYYVNLIADRFFYVPNITVGFGGGSVVDQLSEQTLSMPFAFGLSVGLGTFEVKINEHIGLTANLLTLTYNYTKMNVLLEEMPQIYDAYAQSNSVSFGLNYGASVGVKYYF